MQPGALRALEFDRIVDAVRTCALTPMGDARLSRMAPSTDPKAVAQLLAATTETTRYLGTNSMFPLRASSDLPNILGALQVEGRPLEPLRLILLASFLDSVDESKEAIRRAPGSFPLLEAATGGAASFRTETADVRAKIDPSGDVADNASPLLRQIRDRLRKQKSRLRSTLESYLRGKDTSKYLQDQVVTERNGRYVIVVKAEHRGSIPGIVHGSSASGASLFLEPLSTVDINNDIVAAEEQEKEEVHRILLELTDAFRSRAGDMHRTIAAATELDVLQARARFSDIVDGVEPALSSDGAFELLQARHPLLMSQVVSRLDEGQDEERPRKPPVPVTIRIQPPSTVLLVTGPNTGGKTVALKTAGLLALMAQSGLRIPVAVGSKLPVFRSLFADIGDEQSISASLSTFSAHIANIAEMDRRLDTPALVLLDEVGSGTDPIEGGALGVAIIDHLKKRGATVIATSHYDALKTYASTTDGVTSAAFGFNVEDYAPTYQLIYGSPGRSLALEIAARLGLNASVIAAARRNLSVRETQLAEHLAQIDKDMRSLEHEQRLATREREALATAATRLRQREDAIRQREESSRKRMNDEIEAQLRNARREIDVIVAGLKARTNVIARGASNKNLTTGDAGTVRSEARLAVERVAKKFADPAGLAEAEPEVPSRPAVVGDRVAVGGLGLEGVVTAIQGNTAEIDVRGKRMRASVKDLKVKGSAPQPKSSIRVNVDLGPRETGGVPSELNLIGCTVDEALTRAERFLDDTLMSDQQTVRFIHGYGTGQLRRALAGFLQKHPLVAHFEQADPDHGGGAVTVAELKA